MTNAAAVLIWLLLLLTVVGLSLLLWTRWGQYRPFAKCLGLSLILHAALLLFGSTLELAQRLRAPEERQREQVVWLETVETEALADVRGLGGNAPLNQPWDRLLPSRHLSSPELELNPPAIAPPAPDTVHPSDRPLEAPKTALPEAGTEAQPEPTRPMARRRRPEELLEATQSELAPGVPDIEQDRPPVGPALDTELAAPEQVQQLPEVRRRGTTIPLREPGLPEPELRVEPHELSEPVARRATARPPGGAPALADDLPLRPHVPTTATKAPAAHERPQALATVDAPPQAPALQNAAPQRRSRAQRTPLHQADAADLMPRLSSVESGVLQGQAAGEQIPPAPRATPPQPASGAPVAATETGLQPRDDRRSEARRTASTARATPPPGLLGPGAPAPVAEVAPRRQRSRKAGRLRRLLSGRPLPLPGAERGSESEAIPARTAAELASIPTELRIRVAPQRHEILLRRGGSPETEQAVAAALAWLAAHQSPDGRWDADGFTRRCPDVQPCGGEGTLTQEDTAITGLALLAFLGAGHTHRDGQYASVVTKGLRWLISQQRGDGDLRGQGRMYSHGIATIALCEAYALTRDPVLWEPAYRAAMFVVQAQNPTTGGWRYQPRAVICDTSVYGWQLLALRSARLAGVPVPDETWQRAARWLPRVSWGKAGGLASYLERSMDRHGPTPPMTAEALACRLFLGVPTTDPGVQEAVAYLSEHLPDYRLRNVYYWYYASLSLSQVGGEAWKLWNEQMKTILLRTQRRSGHAKGSWDPAYNVAWDTVGGRIYTTALSTLCLEVYYRYAYTDHQVASRTDRGSAATESRATAGTDARSTPPASP